jgi:hypothetical protein
MHVSIGKVFTDRMKMLGHNKATGGFWGSSDVPKGVGIMPTGFD